MFPEISARWSLSEQRFRYLTPGREDDKKSVPRPYETEPFNPVGSVCPIKSLTYQYWSLPVTASKWYVKVCLSGNYLTSVHVLIKATSLRFRTITQVILTYNRVRVGAYWRKIHGVFSCVFLCIYWKRNRPLSRSCLNVSLFGFN